MQGHETPTDEVSPYGLGSQSMQDTSGPADFASEAASQSSQQGEPLAGSGNSGSLHSQKSGLSHCYRHTRVLTCRPLSWAAVIHRLIMQCIDSFVRCAPSSKGPC